MIDYIIGAIAIISIIVLIVNKVLEAKGKKNCCGGSCSSCTGCPYSKSCGQSPEDGKKEE